MDNWERYEGIEAAERILRAAISAKAHEIHVSCDSDGASIFFVSHNHIEFFHHVPVHCREVTRSYLRGIATIDIWEQAPANGFGIFKWDGDEFNLEVQVRPGPVDDDVVVKIAEFADPDDWPFELE